jgi:hypothetical protein
MNLEKIEQTLETLIPEMPDGFIVKTKSGEFFLHKNDGLGDVIAVVRELLESRQRNWVQHGCNNALAQLDRYIELMGSTPGGGTRLQAERVQGFLEALYFAELISGDDVSIYSLAIDAVTSDGNPFLTEGQGEELPSMLRKLAQ